jgi:hypothetical protein
MYIRFIFGQLKVLGMVLLSFFLFPFVTYPKRKKIWNMKDLLRKKWYFWFADTSEVLFGDYNYLNSVYGIYELVKDENGLPDYDKFYNFSKLRKFFLAYHWMVFRNGAWNYIVSVKPIDGDRYQIRKLAHEGDASIWMLRNKKIFGKQFVTWKIEGTRLFRYSFTKKFLGRYLNVQAGAGYDRFILKFRMFKL